MKYIPVIGLEVHVELMTKSKMFCRCSANYFGQKPNTHTCPVCLGLPGALPYPNREAIEACIKIGLALNCEIPLFSKFDRKNYFYPDLSKGYQISQYDQPFCIEGSIELSNGKNIRIRRVHMEEDTGKLIHEKDSTLIDFNRSGVPLVEIVTEPDFENANEVTEYLKKLQQIVRYLGVSEANMEKGEMRLEPNISLSSDSKLAKYKVEVKNINSFSFVAKAIDYEVNRQQQILEKGEVPVQETRGFVEKSSSTVTQRVKEEASDYRYFPEPDIPPFRWTKEKIKNLKSQMPELPDAKLKRFIADYSLSRQTAGVLTREKATSDYFEESVNAGKNLTPTQIANFIVNRKPNIQELLPAELVERISDASQALEVSEAELGKAIDKVLAANRKAIDDYKNGRENAIMFLVGQVMRAFPKNLEASKVKASLLAKIKKNG
jgi:aspartyl-tRNA(Asn)/glutamyl-tRNA(Gln) amidotransferase subunit B